MNTIKRIGNLSAIFALILIVGCGTLYSTIVTMTNVVDAAMKDWAAASVAGHTTPDIDAKVTAAHDKYRQAAAVASDALKAYKAGGDQATYVNALNAARVAASGLIDLIVPLVTQTEGAKLKTQIAKATAP